MIWQLRFSLCKTPITCYHYQPLLTITLSQCSPARHWTMPIFFCEAWLHTDREPQLHSRFFFLLFFNLLLPDTPKNNAAQMDRVRDNRKFWTGTFAGKQHFNPWKRCKNVTDLLYQVYRTEAYYQGWLTLGFRIQLVPIASIFALLKWKKKKKVKQNKHTILMWALPVSNLLNSGVGKHI